jgi:WD40 repeat protein
VSNGRELASAPVSADYLLALTPDGKALAVARGAKVALLDPENLSVRNEIENDGSVGGDIVISPDGDTIAYAVDDTLLVRPLADPDSAGTLFPTGDRVQPTGIAFAKDKRTVYATRTDGLTLAWDAVGDRQLVRQLALPPRPDPAQVQEVGTSPDGRTVGYLVTDGAESWAVQFLDVATATWTRRTDFVFSSTFSVDIAWDRAGRLFATAWGDQWARVWDPRTARLVTEYEVPEDHGVTTYVGFSGDGARAVVGTDEGWLHEFDTSSGRSVGRPVHAGAPMPTDRGIPVLTLDVDTHGNRAIASVGGLLYLVDLTTGTVLHSKDVGFLVKWFARSPAADTVTVTGHAGEDARRVATIDPQTLELLSGPTTTNAVGNPGFSRDGNTWLASDENVVSLEVTAKGGSRGSLRLGVGGIGGSFVGSAALTPDGSRVLIASNDAGAFIWDPAPATATRAACQMAGRDLTQAEWTEFLPDRKPFAVCPQ